MVLTKAYLRYVESAVLGVVASSNANGVVLESDESGYRAAVPALEAVVIWNVKKGEKIRTLKAGKHEVTTIALSPDGVHIAVGYQDGVVRVWNLNTGSVASIFTGHKSAVSALQYDADGSRLVSGSKDTDVVVWDVVGEAGLFRLKGHKGMITCCWFMMKANVLVTSSKDTFVKFWDLDTQHCFLTLVEHANEVTGFVFARRESFLVTGSADNNLRLWEIRLGSPPDKNDSSTAADLASAEGLVQCRFVGQKQTQKVTYLGLDKSSQFMGCQGADNTLQIYCFRSEKEIEKRMRKKTKRESDKKPTVDDIIFYVLSLRASAKLRSFHFCWEQKEYIVALLLLQNNSFEVQRFRIVGKSKLDGTKLNLIAAPGHRTDIRTIQFSSDDSSLLSASNGQLKVYELSSQQCSRTLECGYAVSSMFVPGDRHAIIGTKNGEMQLFDLASGSLLETVAAHKGAIWSMCLTADKRGFVSGSADHEARFWEFELIQDDDYSKTSKRLSVAHVKTLKMTDDVLGVKYSPDQRLLAVALLDHTVKVFFSDTLKYFLCLYGHKLPVLAMDISSDSSLIATGSADKNIKLWGLDFGDCHKSIFAHGDSIMAVQFVPKTHLLFSASKDFTIKCWDADKFELVQTLEGHLSEIWCIAVSHDGNTVASGSHDRSLRLWTRTQEPLFIEEEREQERETEMEEEMAKVPEIVVPGETKSEIGMAGKKTIETIKAAERLMEAIDLAKEETAKLDEHEETCRETGKQIPLPPKHPLLVAYGNLTPSRYVLAVVKKVKSSELEESLLVLPFAYVMDLLQILDDWLKNGLEIELSCRCVFFLLRIHHDQIVASKSLLPVVDSLRQQTRKRVHETKDVIGFNIAGLRFLQRKMEESNVVFFEDVPETLEKKKKKRNLSVQAKW
ncbi:WD repeat-containing protein 3-like [Oscarella lobularis]|uniref:WD repeat-containing protein 3-like n=1 Tax=Oscarella lobularis TaxID=121494 RepID=UPI0033141D54